MELDDRKVKILQAIVRNYLETGEPVGSRTISKYTDLNLSSATIRNEMADLEETGYIIQPHTSAGRIPSDKGYRWYVDQLMDQKIQEVDEMKQSLLEKADRLEKLLQQAARVLASNTNYATMISSPLNNQKRLKFIQLSQVDEEQLIVVIVLEGNIVKNQIVTMEVPLTNEEVLKMNMLLNTSLNGLTLSDINLAMITKLKEQMPEQSELFTLILDKIAVVLKPDEDLEIYTSGTTNIFKYPELADKQSAQEILSAFEEKQQLAELVTQTMKTADDREIQVYIGSESNVETMKDCSVVTATYDLGEGMKGTVGIIGPKRMDYENVMKSLKTMMFELDVIFHKEQ